MVTITRICQRFSGVWTTTVLLLTQKIGTENVRQGSVRDLRPQLDLHGPATKQQHEETGETRQQVVGRAMIEN